MRAEARQLPDVQRLLRSAQLPDSDLTAEHLGDFLVGGDAPVRACVGLERFGDAALLRSLCVEEASRGAGLGEAALEAIERHARASGVRQIFLLTTTATDFFRRRGYVPMERLTVPAAIQATTEFASLCPASAACLHKELR